jgi:hypothetical protein
MSKPVSKLGGWKPGKLGHMRAECRVCLEPTAEVRECCTEPLCAHCWASKGFCPRCGVELMMVNLTGVQAKAGENLRAQDTRKVRHLCDINRRLSHAGRHTGRSFHPRRAQLSDTRTFARAMARCLAGLCTHLAAPRSWESYTHGASLCF